MTSLQRRRAKRHWSAISESGSLRGIRLMLAIYDRFGARAYQGVLFLVGLYYWLRRPIARHASREYQQRLKAFCPSVALPRLTTVRHFTTFGTAILDKVLALYGRITPESIHIEQRETLRAAIDAGRGGIIVVTHLGSHEVCQALGRLRRDLKMSVVMHTQHAQRFNSLFAGIDRPMPVEMIEVSDMGPATAQRLQARVAEGGFVVIAADREPVEAGARRRWIDFLGQKAPFPEGAFWLAMLLRCPLYLLVCAREGQTHHVHFESLGDAGALSRRERDAWMQETMAHFVSRLEHFCCRYPLQWFNFYPFWQSEKPDARPPR
ncbi:glycosyl transferase [Kushneria indalinina]|uniref:LpxL/LpxP family acyltransferase n=1 Tax=Kushneria indalinina TaxID=184067 RepID=UPI000E22C80B|nr:glycosyl transferase [Kushneria indalinina]